MKKAILIVCFGGRNIEQQLDKLKNKLNTKYNVYYAFTSKFFVKKYGYGLEDMLKTLYYKKYEEIICMPLFVIDGAEYEKTIYYTNKYKDNFKSIKITKPLLSENMEDVILFIKSLYTENLLFVCHGTDEKANNKYEKLFYNFKDENIFFANIESKPFIEDVIYTLKENNIQHIKLVPFLLFKGNHIEKDIKYHIKNKLISNNINVKEDLNPLLQYDDIINIFIKKLMIEEIEIDR